MGQLFPPRGDKEPKTQSAQAPLRLHPLQVTGGEPYKCSGSPASLSPTPSVQAGQRLCHLLTGPVFPLRPSQSTFTPDSPPFLEEPCGSSTGFPYHPPPPCPRSLGHPVPFLSQNSGSFPRNWGALFIPWAGWGALDPRLCVPPAPTPGAPRSGTVGFTGGPHTGHLVRKDGTGGNPCEKLRGGGSVTNVCLPPRCQNVFYLPSESAGTLLGPTAAPPL